MCALYAGFPGCFHQLLCHFSGCMQIGLLQNTVTLSFRAKTAAQAAVFAWESVSFPGIRVAAEAIYSSAARPAGICRVRRSAVLLEQPGTARLLASGMTGCGYLAAAFLCSASDTPVHKRKGDSAPGKRGLFLQADFSRRNSTCQKSRNQVYYMSYIMRKSGGICEAVL